MSSAAQQQAQNPLNTSWTLWYDGRKDNTFNQTQQKQQQTAAAAESGGSVTVPSANEWVASLVEIKTVSTVEEFWSLFMFLKKPSSMELRTNYYLFKKGFKPSWEENSKGGRWVIPIQGDDRSKIDKTWEELLMAAVGERLEAGNSIIGVALSKRWDNFKLAIWTVDNTDLETNTAIGRTLKKELECAGKKSISYMPLEAATPTVLITL